MKQFFVIITILFSNKTFGQTEEIYRLTFGDKSNFTLTTLLNHKLPKTLFIIDTTETWDSNRFWLPDFDNRNKEQVIKRIQNDEHHPYFHRYLFSDTVLNKLFSDKEKQKLFKRSKALKSKPVNLNASNYKTISSSKNTKGFYFVTSEPIISDDKKFAFIDLTVFCKETYKQPLNETYFGTISIVFQKQGNSWKRIAKKDWLIL
ncbi:hypothetical protein QTN47_21335 [Danxiaibacter flavus]|uniref:Uncharacterized protein n=1 Tax=Danxiaibacter flavus TaxID=3049108 RepID=A0ABV3ZJL6_9BACT|nr:hypothetical protein QNM32_21340 [Chitinophagaceae bacterium DXS]